MREQAWMGLLGLPWPFGARLRQCPADFSLQLPGVPWPLPPSQQEVEKRGQKISQEALVDKNCKQQIPLLPTFHWPGFGRWPHKAAKEAGKCHLAVYAGGKGNRFGEQWPVSARALPTGHQIPVSLFPPR